MITAIKIQPQMDCGYICQKIHEAIIKHQKENPDLTDALVIIDIRKPNNDIDCIPKLEYNNN